MSMHPSLKLQGEKTKTKTVLKRTERIRILMEKGLWNKDSSIYGLPKIKVTRIKIKKEKTQEKPTETATTETKSSSSATSNK